jgi:transglutaminase-like putative cysteine protease
MKTLPLLLLSIVAFSLLAQQPVRTQEPGQESRLQPVKAGTPALDGILSRASDLEIQGRFKDAAGLLAKALGSADLPASQRKTFEFELDRLERIKKDFPFDQAGLLITLKKSVADLTADEYEQWLKEGRFDGRQIDGERRFVSASVSNLFFRYPELRPRRRPPKDTDALERRFLDICRTIKKAASRQKTSYVLPKRFHVVMTVTAEAGAAPAGEIVRAWLPVPRLYPYQSGFELVSAAPAAAGIEGPESPIRCLYLEQPAAANRPVEFKIEYEYTRYGVCPDIQAEAVRPTDAEDPALREFMREGPHVKFTAEMRELSRKIVGRETNPCRKAKMIYDWIADHVKYSYAIEYSTIRNISDYCRAKGYGDCGQEAFLFITLCRLNGIPARWQSGWHIFPGLKSIHDWSEIYLAPYGWVPVDPYMGIFAMRYATTLSAEQRREVRDFYFGGMDQYRMAANSNHSQSLTPPKQSMRSDTVDFQRGELEYGAHNIYFDQYSYELTYKEVEPVVSKVDPRGRQFLGIDDFSRFQKQSSSNSETVLTSPVIAAGIPWDELVASWNADAPDGAYLKVEARALYPEGATKFYTMGLWSSNPDRHPRESVNGQKDADGDVHTDTLALKRAARQLQIRVTLGGGGTKSQGNGMNSVLRIKFLGLSLLDSKASPAALPPCRAAWNKLVPVPERSQMAYPGGNVWCSPTTTSMLMAYWSQRLKRRELDCDVPQVVAGVYDPNWHGTGNWPFNMAFAGSYRGMRAYVTRLSDVAEVEQWIAAGLPVGLSVSYNRLRRNGRPDDGHLVVCVGFTASGDPIINDPGTLKNVRKTFPRKDLVDAWSYSRNTAYLVYPENSVLPKDSFGHWDSWLAGQRITWPSSKTPGS